jgi:hypothetical protein
VGCAPLRSLECTPNHEESHQTGPRFAVRGRTFEMTTRPVTFSVTFQLAATFRPAPIARHAMRNNATVAVTTTVGQINIRKSAGASWSPNNVLKTAMGDS